MKAFFVIVILAFITACSHPLEIFGEGDIVSASGTRNCSLEQQPCGNTVIGDYQEKFSAVPRLGWNFIGWEGCDQFPDCSINISGQIVSQHWGRTVSPLRAVFAKNDPPPIAPTQPDEEAIVGEISRIGELDEHKVTLASGDSIHIRVSDTSDEYYFVPEVWLYNPDGTVLQYDSDGTTVEFDCNPGSSSCKINQSGEYRLVVGDSYNDRTGSYEIHFVNVQKSNANGALSTDGVVGDEISLGDLDIYTFAAQSGDSVHIRILDTSDEYYFTPEVWLYRPDGTVLQYDSDGPTVEFDCNPGSRYCTINQSGEYRLVIGDSYSDLAGSYSINFVNVLQSNENGALLNDRVTSGGIVLGDVDTFTFAAQSGDSVHIRISDAGDEYYFAPEVWLYNPDGTVLQYGSDGTTVEFDCNSGSSSCKINQSGKYRLVIGDSYSDLAGSYEIHFVNVLKSNENGALSSDGVIGGDLSLGDLDTYTFAAQSGESVHIRVSDSSDEYYFVPEVWLYRPDGTVLQYDSDGTTVEFDCNPGSRYCTINQSGEYRLVVGESYSDLTGNYSINFVGPDQNPNPGEYIAWPLKSSEPIPSITQDHTCGSCFVENKHHTGLDLVPVGSDTNVYAAAGGTIVAVHTSCLNGVKDCNYGFGNTVSLKHDNKYSLYAHLAPGSITKASGNVYKGEKIGVMGATGNVSGAHLHFELNNREGLGAFGYSSSHPINSGYLDPWAHIDDIAIEPTGLEIVNFGGAPIRKGPGIGYGTIADIGQNQKVVAFAKVRVENGNSWYRVHLPCRDGLSSCAGWLAGNYLNARYSQINDDIIHVAIRNTGEAGLNVKSAPAVSGNSIQKVWDGQRFALLDVNSVQPESGCNSDWYQINLPTTASTPQGWVCGDNAILSQ